MGVHLTDAEAWEVLRTAPVGILTSLRADGAPVSLPVWFVVVDQRIYVAGPSASVKFHRVRKDERVAFLVESGQRWVELQAVHVNGRARVVDDPDWQRIDPLLDEKYSRLRAQPTEQSSSAKARYAARSLIEIVPDKLITWDNARLDPRR